MLRARRHDVVVIRLQRVERDEVRRQLRAGTAEPRRRGNARPAVLCACSDEMLGQAKRIVEIQDQCRRTREPRARVQKVIWNVVCGNARKAGIGAVAVTRVCSSEKAVGDIGRSAWGGSGRRVGGRGARRREKKWGMVRRRKNKVRVWGNRTGQAGIQGRQAITKADKKKKASIQHTTRAIVVLQKYAAARRTNSNERNHS